MYALLIALGGLLAVLMLLGRRPDRPRRPAQDYEIQFQIEEHDIEQMLDARGELRRRTGRPDLGDELAEQLREQLRDG